MPKRTATEITYGFSNQYDMQSLNVYIFCFVTTILNILGRIIYHQEGIFKNFPTYITSPQIPNVSVAKPKKHIWQSFHYYKSC